MVSPDGSPPVEAGKLPKSAICIGFSGGGDGQPYFKVYNSGGQEISPVTGRIVLGQSVAHYPLDLVRTFIQKWYLMYNTHRLHGQEVMRISLETNGIYLHLSVSQIQIYGSFTVDLGSARQKFSLDNRSGDLSTLWSLVGRSLTEANIPGIFRLCFGDDVALEVLSNQVFPRIAILSTAEGKYFYDEY